MYRKAAGPFARAMYVPKKTIPIPVSGRVDVTELWPITEHPRVQRTRYRKQLSFHDILRPGAVHTRFEHMLGVLHQTRNMIKHFQLLDPSLMRALEVEAFLHDLGHGPFSHESERVLGADHNAIGRAGLLAMRDVISRVADFDVVLALFERTHPASCLVHDRNFGADKLDYLTRDAYHTGYELGLNIDSLLSHLMFDGQQLGVEEKMQEEAIRIQYSYLSMYTKLYLHKTGKIAARMYQRALQHYLANHPEECDGWWELTDVEAEARLAYHPLMRAIRERDLPKTVCVLKIAGCEADERIGERGYQVLGFPAEVMQRASTLFEDPHRLLDLENELEERFGWSTGSVIISQTGRYDKLVPVDVQLFCLAQERFTSLFERVPSHLGNLREMADRAFAIRITVRPEFVKKALGFQWTNIVRESSSAAHLFTA